MNSEMFKLEQQKKSENNLEKREISPEFKEALGKSWTEMIVDNTKVPEDINKTEQDKIKEWLFKSIMEDTENVSNELSLQVDEELIKKIEEENGINEKATLELEYIKKMHKQIDDRVKDFDRSGNKSTDWDSWPKKMRETGEFNCTGATLLGINFLEKAGIESYCGRPCGHVTNVAKLSSGEWWYVDFRNGEQNLIKIEPEETIINNISVLKINHPDIDYNLIPIHDNSEVVGSVLGNLHSLEQKAGDERVFDESIEKKEAVEYFEKYKHNFEKTDFSSLHKSLYPELVRIDETEEMRTEKERIDKVRE